MLPNGFVDSRNARLHFYVNFFLPVIELEEKVRIGSRVKRVYDDPLTPYALPLASDASTRTASTVLCCAPSTDPRQGICPESPIGVQWSGFGRPGREPEPA
jgi:hypothetical protein